METKEYILARIDGDYAYLKRTDVPSEDELFIARALLPPDADEGSSVIIMHTAISRLMVLALFFMCMFLLFVFGIYIYLYFLYQKKVFPDEACREMHKFAEM